MALSANRVTSEVLGLGLQHRNLGGHSSAHKRLEPRVCPGGHMEKATDKDQVRRPNTWDATGGFILPVDQLPCVERMCTHLCVCVYGVLVCHGFFKWHWGTTLNHTEPLSESFPFHFSSHFSRRISQLALVCLSHLPGIC